MIGLDVNLGTDAGPGVPRADYMAGVVSAARAAGLPADGIAALEALARAGAGDPPPARPRAARRAPFPAPE